MIVLYGHISELSPSIFVGAPLDEGDLIGNIGSFNEPHVHIEIRNLSPNDDFDPVLGSSDKKSTFADGPGRQFGFLRNYPETNAHGYHLYDVTQFFGESVNVTGETQQITSLGLSLSNGGSVTIPGDGGCSLNYTNAPFLDQPENTVNGYRGFTRGYSGFVKPVSPDTIPTIPTS